MAHMLAAREKRLGRNELARFYPWKQHNRLAPLNLYKRPLYDYGEDSRISEEAGYVTGQCLLANGGKYFL